MAAVFVSELEAAAPRGLPIVRRSALLVTLPQESQLSGVPEAMAPLTDARAPVAVKAYQPVAASCHLVATGWKSQLGWPRTGRPVQETASRRRRFILSGGRPLV